MNVNVSPAAAPARLRALGVKGARRGAARLRSHRHAALVLGSVVAAFLLALAAGDDRGARAGAPLGGDGEIAVAKPRVAIPGLSGFGPLPDLQVPVAPGLPPLPTAPVNADDPPAPGGEPPTAAPSAGPSVPRPAPAVPPATSASHADDDAGEDDSFFESVPAPPPDAGAPAEDAPDAPPAEEPAPAPTVEPTPAATPGPTPAATPAPAPASRLRRLSRPRA